VGEDARLAAIAERQERAASGDDRHQEHRYCGIGKRRAMVIHGWGAHSRQDQYALGDVEHRDARQQDEEQATYYIVFHRLFHVREREV
jgi:hypothetical protein